MLQRPRYQIFLLLITILSTFLLFTMCKSNNKTDITLIPLPQKIEAIKGNFTMSNATIISSDFQNLNDYFIESIRRFTGIGISTNNDSPSNKISFKIDSSVKNPEGYILDIDSDNISISASTEKGLFLAMQTIFQLIPAEVKANPTRQNIIFQNTHIVDEPAFSWRGLNLDCARHFMEKDFIKRYIDILAYYKFNTFHWHLTEDQGWRIEIEKYPKLTEIGAWRKESKDSVYGGFYTKDDIKEIVEYAQSRYINIVPEIEMPGHSLASLAAYPENSCTGGPFEVTNIWGVHNDIYCAGKEEVFTFLQNILDEVIEMFPGKYIHIGGDEAPKNRWEKCPLCQKRIKDEGLKDEHELQSYFIKRIVNYLHSQGKEVIGWDEILQGGLAPGVIVQSWQGVEGAIKSAKLGHYTICSPTSHTYFDYDPSDFNLENVYSFNPIPDGLDAEESKFVLGSEANMWSERAPQETIDSKLFPRMLALSEVLWLNPDGTGRANYRYFHSRVQENYKDMDARSIKYGRESKIFEPVTNYNKHDNSFSVEIKQGQKDVLIKYTTDGSVPDSNSPTYKAPIKISQSTVLKISAFKNNNIIGNIWQLPFVFHKALNCNITLKNKYNERYKASGDLALVDGVRGTSNFKDGNWQGYEGVDLEAVIDLGKEQEISKVTTNFFFDTNSWIFLPKNVKFSISKDGTTFTHEVLIENDIQQKSGKALIKEFSTKYNNVSARFVKLSTETLQQCPDWHPGKGQPAWLFVDEILVD